MRKQISAAWLAVATAALLSSCVSVDQRPAPVATPVAQAGDAAAAPGAAAAAPAAPVHASTAPTAAETSAAPVTKVGIHVRAGDYDPLGTGQMFNGQIYGVVTDARDLDPVYVVDEGQIYLDLTAMQPLAEAVSVTVFLNSGHFDVKLPTNVPVKLHCGVTNERNNCKTGSYNTHAAGQPLTLTIHAGTARVTIATEDS